MIYIAYKIDKSCSKSEGNHKPKSLLHVIRIDALDTKIKIAAINLEYARVDS